MRLVAIPGTIILITALAAAARPARAHEGPWCALYPGGEGTTEICSLESFERCLDEIHGTGGSSFCARNPRYRRVPVGLNPPHKFPRR
jgi:hypothetical protein